MPAGFLYVLINPSMPGLAKVGKTTRNPTDRMAELSSATGVPSAFMLAFQQPVAECDSAELWVHRELEREGFRHADNREFFNAPLHEIIQVVAQAANLVFDATNLNDSDTESQDYETNSEDLAEELFNLGCAYVEGTDSVLRNKKRALDYFEQAAALGHANACSYAATTYQYGDGVCQDMEKALTLYSKAVRLGSWWIEADIATLFLAAKQEGAAQAHWKQFFKRACEEIEHEPNDVRGTIIGNLGTRYFLSIAAGDLAHCVPNQAIVCLAEPILKSINTQLGSEQSDEVGIRLRIAIYLVEEYSEKKVDNCLNNANIAIISLRTNQEAQAKAQWYLFFERAGEEIERAPDEVRDKIGDCGRLYCESVSSRELAHCVPDQAIVRLAELILKSINIQLSEQSDGVLAGRLRRALCFVEGNSVLR